MTPYTWVIPHGEIKLKQTRKHHTYWLAIIALKGVACAIQGGNQSLALPRCQPCTYNNGPIYKEMFYTKRSFMFVYCLLSWRLPRKLSVWEPTQLPPGSDTWHHWGPSAQKWRPTVQSFGFWCCGGCSFQWFTYCWEKKENGHSGVNNSLLLFGISS